MNEQPDISPANSEVPSLMELLQNSWTLGKENSAQVIAIALKWFLGPIVLLIAIVALFHSSFMVLGLSFFLYAVAFIPLMCGAYGGMTELAIARVQSRKPRYTFGRAGAILGVSLLVFLMEMVLSIPFQLAKLGLIATLVSLFFYIRFGLLVDVIVAEDTNVDAISRTWRLWKGNGSFLASRMLGYYLIIIGVVGVPALVLLFSFGGLTSIVNPNGLANWPLLLTIGLLIAVPGFGVSFFIDPFFKALLYQEVRGSKLSVPEAVPPIVPEAGMYDFNT